MQNEGNEVVDGCYEEEEGRKEVGGGFILTEQAKGLEGQRAWCHHGQDSEPITDEIGE